MWERIFAPLNGWCWTNDIKLYVLAWHACTFSGYHRCFHLSDITHAEALPSLQKWRRNTLPKYVIKPQYTIFHTSTLLLIKTTCKSGWELGFFGCTPCKGKKTQRVFLFSWKNRASKLRAVVVEKECPSGWSFIYCKFLSLIPLEVVMLLKFSDSEECCYLLRPKLISMCH